MYVERCKQRVEAGRKGGFQKAANRAAKAGDSSTATNSLAKLHKDKDTSKDKDMFKNKDDILSYAHPPEEAACGDGSAEVCAAGAAPARESSSASAVQKNLSAAMRRRI